MVICNNCGGKFKNEFSYCPYCGHINETSARKNFLNKMRKVTKDLENLPEESKNIYKNEMKKEVHKTKKILLLIGSLVIIFSIFSFFLSLTYKNDSEDIKEEIYWEKEYFPYLDELYEQKNYEAILEFMEDHYDEPGECFYRWKHYEFLDLFEDYTYVLEIMEEWQEKSKSREDYIGGWIYSAANLYFYEYLPKMKEYLTEHGKELETWKKEAAHFLFDYLKFTEEELDIFGKEAFEEGYLSFTYCKKYGKNKLESF